MRELEKVLEEIDAEIEKERAMCEDIEDTPGWRLYEKTMNIAKGIIRRHIDGKDSNVPTNDGWIPVDERLPELNEDGLSEDVLVSFSDSHNIFTAFYDFNRKG